MTLDQVLAQVAEAKELSEAGRLNDAAEVAAKAVEAVESLEAGACTGEVRFAHARACEILGDIYADDLRCAEAADLFGRAARSAFDADANCVGLGLRLKQAVELEHYDRSTASLELLEVDLPEAIDILPDHEFLRDIIAGALNAKARSLENLGRCGEAAEAFVAAARLRLDAPGSEAARIAAAYSLRKAAESLLHVDEFEEAERVAREAVELARAGGGAVGPHLLQLARVLDCREEAEEGARVAVEAVDALEEELDPDTDDYVAACLLASRLHDDLGDGNTALELAAAAIETIEEAEPVQAFDASAAHHARAEALLTLDCDAEGLEAFREAVRYARLYAEWDTTVTGKSLLAERLRRLARQEAAVVGLAEAEPFYAEIRTLLTPYLDEPDARRELAAALAERAYAYAAFGYSRDGAESFAEAVAIGGEIAAEGLARYWDGMLPEPRAQMHRHLPEELRFVFKP